MPTSSTFERISAVSGAFAESRRIAALHELALLDTAAESTFDDFTRVAAALCGTSIALISLVDSDRVWFKSKYGIELESLPRPGSFCSFTVEHGSLFEVNNALEDPRFCDSDLVRGASHIRFYAGCPLTGRDGLALGTLCVLDREPRTLSATVRDALLGLARQVQRQLEFRHTLELWSERLTVQRAVARVQSNVGGDVLATEPVDHVLEELVACTNSRTGTLEEVGERGVGRVHEVTANGFSARTDAPAGAAPAHVITLPIRSNAGLLALVQLERSEGPFDPARIALLDPLLLALGVLLDTRDRQRKRIATERLLDRRTGALASLDKMWALDDQELETRLRNALGIALEHLGLVRSELMFRKGHERFTTIEVGPPAPYEVNRVEVVHVLYLRSSAGEVGEAHFFGAPRTVGTEENGDQEFFDLTARFLSSAIEREEREQSRAQAFDRLQKIAAHVPGVIFQYRLYPDGTSCFPYASEGIRDTYRLGPEDVRSDASAVFEALHPEDRELVRTSIVLSATRLTPWYDRHRVRFEDGTVRWLDGHATPTRLADGSTLWHGFINDVTDRIHQARALEAEREMNRRLLEAMPVAVVACDEHGTLNLFNHVARNWHGVESLPSEPDQWSEAYDLYQSDGCTPLSKDNNPLFRALRGETVRDAEICIVTKGQPVRHVTTNGAILSAKDGTAMGAVAVMLDISARKRAEAELHRTAATLRHVLDAAVQAAIIATDHTGRITIFNSGAERMLGYQAAEVIGQSPTSFHTAREIERRARELSKELGTPISGFRVLVEKAERAGAESREWTFVTKEGALLPVSLYASTIRDEAGRPFGYLSIAVDNSERLRSEATLREHARNIQAILDNVVDAIVTIDGRGHIASFNPAAERVFGISRTEMLGRSVRLLLPEDQRSGALSQLIAARGTSVELEGQRADGTRFTMEIAVSNLERGGRPLFIGIVRDVSERRRIERMKSEFTSTVSHELRTPLTSIAGSLGLLDGGAMGELPEQAMRMIGIAYKNCQRLTDLINDLLDIDKILAGKMRFDLRNHFVMPLVNQALAANEGYALRHNVRYALVDAVVDAEVCVDPNRLLQILANYLSNAAKFSPPDATVEVTVSASPDTVRIAIRDHGPGVPPAFRKLIFERFSQADSSDTRQRGGTGLGLAITRSLAERMNGTVGFESVEGHGATFYVDLPRVFTPFDDASPTTQIRRLRSDLPDASALPRVLHVEDNADFRAVLRAQCSELAVLEGAATLREARSRLTTKKVQFDVVLLDLELPDGSGFALGAEVRERFPHLPIVILSAAEFDTNDARWASASLVKSRTTPQVLLSTIRESILSSGFEIVEK